MHKLTLEEAIEHLKVYDAYSIFLGSVEQTLDSLIWELPEVPAEKLQMHVGRITTYREMLSLMRGNS